MLIALHEGEVIDEEELTRRFQLDRELNRLHSYYVKLPTGLYVDARFKGGLTRYINHSCEPNTRLVKRLFQGVEVVGE